MAHLISPQYYTKLYQESIKDPAKFWERFAQSQLSWSRQWNQPVKHHRLASTWFPGARGNITIDCLDRHVNSGLANRIAYHHLNESGQLTSITYGQLLELVTRFAHLLATLNVKPGDTVTIYLPLCIEQIAAMLACARLGAVHSVVYAGFSSQALSTRIKAAGSQILITADLTHRRGKTLHLLETARAAAGSFSDQKLLVLKRSSSTKLSSSEIDLVPALNQTTAEFTPEIVDATHPLFILYTSGTTASPKGIVHSFAGYHLYTHLTTKFVFDLQPDDIYWCTADCGWITGHSYIVYGPLSNGLTSLLYEGAPDYPQPDIFWSLIDRFGVTKFYTSPTAIRLFMKLGSKYPKRHQLDSLKIIASVGEPLNPEVWHWYHTHIGRHKAQVLDTWWQTETGGHCLVTLPSLPQKPGFAGLPFFGIEADVIDDNGKPLPPGKKGQLVIKQSWPGALIDCWQDHQRFRQYWSVNPNYFATGDYAIKDQDGYFQILGRLDDILSVSGHRIGSAEVENALIAHPAVVEAAVVSIPDDLTGQAIHAFVVLNSSQKPSDSLRQDLINFVKSHYARHAAPKTIEFIPSLPKTRSGKIMRRLLRNQLLGQDLGDTSTLED